MTDLTGPADPTEKPDERMSMFEMFRHHDVTGFSGVGVVAYGVEFPDRSIAFRWRGPYASTVVFDSIEAVIAVHGHDGATEIRWIASYSVPKPDTPDPTGGTDETGRLGTAWQRHDDLLWPPPDPNGPPPFEVP